MEWEPTAQNRKHFCRGLQIGFLIPHVPLGDFWGRNLKGEAIFSLCPLPCYRGGGNAATCHRGGTSG